MKHYTPELETEMRAFYQSLSEKDRRRYAAIEARKLGYGGHSYIATVLGCERHSVATGVAELRDPTALAQPGIRQPGGGRKPSLAVVPELEATFLQVLRDHTAGSPTDEKIKWTNLTRREIIAGLKEHGLTVSATVVRQLLVKHDYRRRKAQKQEATGTTEHRNEQFLRIGELKTEYLAGPNPVLSMDTKKKS
jgi:hypothetical protein